MNSFKRWILRFAGWASSALPQAWVRRLYRLGPVTRAVRATLNRAAPADWTTVQVTAGLLQGAQFRLNLQEEKDLWLGTYEADLQATLGTALGPGMVVYDVGANVGYLTIAMARLVGPGGHVYAFEPLPDNYARLVEAVDLNEVGKTVTPVRAAVGAQVGRAQFLVHQSGGMGKLQGSAGRDAHYERTLEVDVLTLDEYAQQAAGGPPDWIKIDVEGGEVGVLQGARRLLTERRPGLLLELHGPEAAAGVWRQLGEAGYRLRSIGPDARPVLSVDELDWKAYLLAEPAVERVTDG